MNGSSIVASGRAQQDFPGRGALSAVSIWLWSVVALVFAMIVVGGATRLTDSGLSITEWQPILGAIPPLNDADWLSAFEKYKQIPEYHIVNKGMSLEAFKEIYWWEWSHRFLGRFIGIAFGLPLVFFWLTGRLRAGQPLKLLSILALGGLQGAIGWYMVSSGLVDRIDVSQYRLALHLTVAFAILGLLVWFALGESRQTRAASPVPPLVSNLAIVLVAMVMTQVVLGAFVAGLKAGLVYNTWPDMNGAFLPSTYFEPPLGWHAMFEDHGTVQFHHRIAAYIIGATVVLQIWTVLRSGVLGEARISALVLCAAVLAQMAIGIWTLLAQVPLPLGLLHQGGGAVVLAIAVWHLYETRRRGAQVSPSIS